MSKATITSAVLDALAFAGDKGMRFKDIQDVAYGASHGGKQRPKHQRGWWCTQLLGGHFAHAGLLHVFAVKGEDGRWRRNGVTVPERPWTLVKRDRHPGHSRPY